MAEMIKPGPCGDDRSIREAVCIHTKKIFDACKAQDCIEDLRVYFDEKTQHMIDEAASVKSGCAELLHAYIDVEPVRFNRGFFAVDVRYYYRITAEACVCGGRPNSVTGLAVFSKRCILFGGEGGAKVFSSAGLENTPSAPVSDCGAVPEAVVEVMDPLVLNMKLVDVCKYRPLECGCADIPDAVADCFDAPLTTGGDVHRLYVTLGQFSTLRLERDTQLLIPVYDYCVPGKDCRCDDGGCDKDPCEMFQKVQFPVNDFFPNSGECSC